MLRWEEDVEAHALRRRGWTISAIARHLERDRKTVRAYLRGERQPGQRRSAGDDAFERFAGYVGDDCARTRICGRACSTTRRSHSATRAPTRPSRGRCGSGACGRRARPAPG